MNTNCLEDVRCPRCGQEDNFKILCTAWFDVEDDGTDDPEEVSWGGNSQVVCPECQRRGKLSDFSGPRCFEFKHLNGQTRVRFMANSPEDAEAKLRGSHLSGPYLAIPVEVDLDAPEEEEA